MLLQGRYYLCCTDEGTRNREAKATVAQVIISKVGTQTSETDLQASAYSISLLPFFWFHANKGNHLKIIWWVHSNWEVLAFTRIRIRNVKLAWPNGIRKHQWKEGQCFLF